LVYFLRNFANGEQSDHTYNWNGNLYMNGGTGGSTSYASQSMSEAG